MKNYIYILILSALTLGTWACSSSDDGEPQEPPTNNTDGNKEPEYPQPQLPEFTNKRGIGYGFSKEGKNLVNDAKLLGEKTIHWVYNWGADWNSELEAALNPYQKEFCPMAWNNNYDSNRIKAYKDGHSNCNYLLGFNEPNLTDQASLSPRTAAAYWPRLKTLAKNLNIKLISPAMNYGTYPGYEDPIKWLDDFFAQPNVSIDDVDGIAVHCYMTNVSGLKGFIEKFEKYGKPIWLTEFCAWPENKAKISMDAQMNYMSEALNYLESNPFIERYAWYIPRFHGPVDNDEKISNSLLTPESFTNKNYELSDLGKVYVNMSTLDKTV